MTYYLPTIRNLPFTPVQGDALGFVIGLIAQTLPSQHFQWIKIIFNSLSI